MNTAIRVAIGTLFLFSAATMAVAHGTAAPTRGGVTAMANDLGFELVPGAEGVTLYVDDHGKPMATTGLTGKLVVLHGAEKSEADLSPAGENRLLAKGLKFDKGAKGVATLKLPGRNPMTVRFSRP